jgi:predicted nucleotidyltransferase
VTREDVQRRLAANRSELSSLWLGSVEIFGSVARGEPTPDSDVDLLVDIDRPIGLFHFPRSPALVSATDVAGLVAETARAASGARRRRTHRS